MPVTHLTAGETTVNQPEPMPSWNYNLIDGDRHTENVLGKRVIK